MTNRRHLHTLKENLPTPESSWCDSMPNLAKRLTYFQKPLPCIRGIEAEKNVHKDNTCVGDVQEDQNRRKSTGSTKIINSVSTFGNLTPPGRSLNRSIDRIPPYSVDSPSRTNLYPDFDAKETLKKIYAAPVAFEGLWLANTIPPGRSGINKDLTGLSLVDVLRCLNLVSLTPHPRDSFSESQLLLYDVTANKDKALITRNLGTYFQRVQRSNLTRELKIWSRLSHDSCLRLYGAFQIGLKMHFIVEVASLHTLEHYIGSLPHQSVKESDAQRLIWSAARGLNYLHRHCIVHRDLRPGTLVLGSDMRLKIAGFSKAVKLTAGYSLCLCGRPQFRPPEMFMKTEFDLFKVDVWALGVVGFYILTQILPFPVTYPDVSTRLWPMAKKSWPHSQLSYSFFNCLLEPDPAVRPTALQTLFHKWIHRHINTKS